MSDKRRNELREIARTARSVNEFSRARAVALRSAGWSVAEIAEAFEVTPQAVYGWLDRYEKGGATALRDRPRGGRPRDYGPSYRRIIAATVETRPRQLGLAITVWSVLTLAACLWRTTTRRISPSHLRRILHEEGYVWRRPKLTLRHRQNRRLYRAVQRRLEELQGAATAPGADFVLLYEDEAEFHLNPGLTGMWTLRGVQPEVPSAGQDRKIAAFAAVDWATGRMVWHLADRKNQREFLIFLDKVVKAFPRKRLVLVLDNVAYHKTKAVMNRVEELAGRVELLWLPPYSPNLNRIERIWGHLKRTYVYNEYFGDERGLVKAVEAALNSLNSALHIARGLVSKHGLRKAG